MEVNPSTYTPYKHCLLVKLPPKRQEAVTTSGIIYNVEQSRRDGSDVKLVYGDVIAIGEGVGLKFKRGQTMRVYFNGFDCYSIPDTDFALVKDVALYCIETPA